jgi:hypothetical protein
LLCNTVQRAIKPENVYYAKRNKLNILEKN